MASPPLMSVLALVLAVFMSTARTQETEDVCIYKDNDGCSVPFGAPFFYKDRFTPACNRHDVCYHCGIGRSISKYVCDNVFRDNMKTLCKDVYLNSRTVTSTFSFFGRWMEERRRERLLSVLDENEAVYQALVVREIPRLQRIVYSYPENSEKRNDLIQRRIDILTVKFSVVTIILLSPFGSLFQTLTSVANTLQSPDSDGNFQMALANLQNIITSGDVSKDDSDVARFTGLVEDIFTKFDAQEEALELNKTGNKSDFDTLPVSEDTTLCDRVFGILGERTDGLFGAVKLLCQDIELLACTVFAEQYYLGVFFFGEVQLP